MLLKSKLLRLSLVNQVALLESKGMNVEAAEYYVLCLAVKTDKSFSKYFN